MKRIAFIISGQIRESPLGDYNNYNEILESHSKYLFTDQLKNNYLYDVYIVVDHINRKKCEDYFGEHLKQINTDDFEIPPVNTNGVYNISFISFYRAKIAWEILERTQIKYDYIVKMRPDIVLLNHIKVTEIEY
jgi:hypothetical protein